MGRPRVRRWRRVLAAAVLAAAGAGAAGSVRSAGPRGAATGLLLSAMRAWDAVHLSLEPHADPMRAPEIVDPRPLAEQARAMERDLRVSFLIHGDRLLLPDTPPVSISDACLWQGVYAGAAALRYALERTPLSRRLAERAVEGLAILASRGRPIARSVLPASVPTEEDGRWYFRDAEWQWKEDASVDSAVGWLFGAVLSAELVPSRRAEAARLIRRFAETIVANGLVLRNSDGTRTRYGSLGGDWIGSPAGTLVTLTALQACRRYGPPDPAIEAARERLLKEGQDRWAAYASGPLLWRNMSTNHNLGFLALASALLVEDDPGRRRLYAAGMVRLARVTWKSGNSFWLYLTEWTLARGGPRAPELDEASVAAWVADRARHERIARIAMLEWDYPRSKTKRETINSRRGDLDLVRWPGGPRALRQPLPVWQRPPADFLWQRSAHLLDDWGRYEIEPGQRFAPIDFLAAYYLARLTGALGPNE